MMIVDKIKDFFFSLDDNDGEGDEDEEMEELTEPVRKPVPEPARDNEEREEPAAPVPPPVRENPAPPPVSSSNSSANDRVNSSDRINNNNNSGGGRRNKVVNIQTTAQLQVVLVKPSAFTDAKQIADHLIAKKTVVLNLETASPENKRRIIDFLVGVAYANGGSLKPVANLTYIITPYNVGFIGEDLVGELENNGVFI
ncbi:MAG: cell division protein SepF [Prevotella sp.]|nr:cell division protein SepF [Alistipes senegalensis]MCM1357667.1 cell division protein SepF [Prevotella sp.]MCM1472805.1 cell division protein SepF [Muribaculaceae bacterium]